MKQMPRVDSALIKTKWPRQLALNECSSFGECSAPHGSSLLSAVWDVYEGHNYNQKRVSSLDQRKAFPACLGAAGLGTSLQWRIHVFPQMLILLEDTIQIIIIENQ